MSSKRRALEFLRADLGSARELLRRSKSPLNRASMASRIEQLEEEIRVVMADPRPDTGIEIVFKGDPVVDTRGIDSAFAGLAVSSIAAITGHPHIVTDSVRGSFGFRLEPRHEESVEEAVEVRRDEDEALTLLAKSKAGGEEFTAVALQTDPNKLRALLRFLRRAKSQRAEFTVSSPDERIDFDRADVVRGVEAVADVTVVDDDLEEPGILRGIMQNAGTFEIEMETGEIIKGKLHESITLAEGNEWQHLLNQRVQPHIVARRTVKLNVTQRVSYILKDVRLAAVESS